MPAEDPPPSVPNSPWSRPPIHRPPAHPPPTPPAAATAPVPSPAAAPASSYQDQAYQDPAFQDPAYQDPAYQDPAYQDPAIGGTTYGPPATQYDGYDSDDEVQDYEYERDAYGDRTEGAHHQELEVRMGYGAPTAEEFATRRALRPRDWVASTGVRAAARRSSFGLIRMRPGRRERDGRIALSAVRRAFGGLRQITVVNPKGGAGKTVATLMLGLTFGQARGGFVLTWDNNETQGTLGMRAQPDVHARTVRDLLYDLDRFGHGNGRVGELAAYVRSQDEAMFDVLASDEAATAGEMLTARAFREIRDVVGRFYKLILVDTGNNVRAENWQAAVDATDQLVITMSARNDSAETAARLLDHLEQTGRRELVRRAVTVVTMPPHRKEVNPEPIEKHFDARCRVVLRVPYDRHLDSGAPVRYGAVSPESRRAWLGVAAAVATGL